MTLHRVVTFARYAELMGGNQLEVELPEPATVNDLIIALRSLPGGDLLPEHPLVAVNLSQAALDHRVDPGDELSLLPPMSGG